MFKFLKKNKKFWIPGLISILIILLMITMSKFGFNPLGYVVY
jgi:hypothetical protein